MKITRVSYLLLVIFMMLCCSRIGLLQASLVKTTIGQAVLVDGSEKARSQAVMDALGEALNLYIYEDMAVSQEFEQQVNEKILNNRKSYVKSYEIQSEYTLGDLYQVELRVELQTDLLKQELKKIERGERLQVERLTLVVLPLNGIEPDSSHIDNGGAQALALEPSSLFRSLQQELAIYGFSLEMVEGLSQEMGLMFAQLLETGETENRQRPKASWFQGLLPGDLIVVVRPFKVSEERIVSLNKSFWRSQAEFLFIDTKNDMITYLPKVSAKVINSDYITGLEDLTEKLTGEVQRVCLDRLLRDYVVPRESESMVLLQCQGFLNPVDFRAFKETLLSLRTVKEVSLQALAAGSLELGVRILTSAPLLVKWLNDFYSEDLPFTFQVYPLDETPEHYLVRVNYAPTTGN